MQTIKKGKNVKSVLIPEVPISVSGPFVLNGRLLSLSEAVDRSKAHELAEQNSVKRERSDKRRTYLLREGCNIVLLIFSHFG